MPLAPRQVHRPIRNAVCLIPGDAGALGFAVRRAEAPSRGGQLRLPRRARVPRRGLRQLRLRPDLPAFRAHVPTLCHLSDRTGR